MKIQLVGRIPSKKNSKQIRINAATKKPFICSSKDHEEWHRGMSLALLAMRTPKPRLSGVSVTLEITFGDLRKSDLSNKAESVMDLLVDYGVLADDNYIDVPALSLRGKYVKGQWGCDVTIKRDTGN